MIENQSIIDTFLSGEKLIEMMPEIKYREESWHFTPEKFIALITNFRLILYNSFKKRTIKINLTKDSRIYKPKREFEGVGWGMGFFMLFMAGFIVLLQFLFNKTELFLIYFSIFFIIGGIGFIKQSIGYYVIIIDSNEIVYKLQSKREPTYYLIEVLQKIRKLKAHEN